MVDTQEELSVCPTFNIYSSDKLAQIAARVTDEFKRESEFAELTLSEDSDDDRFEFSLVRDGPEVLYNGQIQPDFPIFNRDLVVNDCDDDNKESTTSDVVESGIGIPLKNLFIQEREEREPPSSSSESDADEIEGIPPGTYCFWRPKIVESSLNCCKKSNSAGSASKRWKILDLLRRSNSEGKDSYVFFTPRHVEATKSDQQGNFKAKKTSGVVVKVASKLKGKGVVASPSLSAAHEAFYVRNRAIRQNDKKKSFLPYRQGLVGFFANANGLSRNFPAF